MHLTRASLPAVVAAAALIAMLGIYPHTAWAADPLDNHEFSRLMGQAQNRQPSDDPVADYDAKINGVSNLKPSNEQQYRLQQLTLMSLQWHRANEWCIALYKSAENVADVGRWLACVTPVNAAILTLAAAIRDQQIEMVAHAEPPDPHYEPPEGRFDGPPRIAHGEDYAAVIETINNVEEAAEQVVDARDTLKALVSDGGPRTLIIKMLAADGTEVTVATGGFELGLGDEGLTLQPDAAAIVDNLVGYAQQNGQPPDTVELEIGISQEHGEGTLELSEALAIPVGGGADQ